MATLQRRGAYQPILRLTPNREFLLRPLPEYLLPLWRWRRCRVAGKVVKQFTIDGVVRDMPVCHARVHICEVDQLRLALPTLPDDLLTRWRDDLLRPFPLPEPRPVWPPVPPVPPFLDLGLREPRPVRALAYQQQAAPELAPAVRAGLLASDLQVVRATLLDNLTLLRPHLCLYPYLRPWLFRCDPIKTVVTDEYGRFDTDIFYQLFGDKPDLYFWIEQEIDGVMTTIYRPSIACHTYWNYACGTELTLRVTDPRVRPGCIGVLNGPLAWVQTIGNAAQVRDIQQTDAISLIQGVPFNAVGCTDWNTAGLGQYGLANRKVRPFGEQLGFWVYFGNETGPGFPIAQYRWTYRKVRSAALGPVSAGDAAWTPIGGALKKPYYIEVTEGGVAKVVTKYYDLDPDNNGIYRIPPADASDIEPGAAWLTRSTWSATFDTNGLKGNGLYEFRLQVFNAAGNPLSPPAEFYQISAENDSTESAPAGSSFFGGGQFRIRMRIDNANVEADLYQPTVNGTAASTECGFLAYGSKSAKSVGLAFRAQHPQDFAIFHMGVIRGAGNEIVEATDAGMVIGSTTDYRLGADGVYRVRSSAGSPTTNLSAADVLGSCDKAAFSSRLAAYYLRTNGSQSTYTTAYTETVAWALEP